MEQGLVMLIQGALGGSPPVASCPGGYFAELPKDQISPTFPMAWTYRSVTSEPSIILSGQDGFTSWLVQIDCHGNTAADAIHLARAIDKILRGGFKGVLADPHATYVDSIVRTPSFVDG